jgi:hypothetical protein
MSTTGFVCDGSRKLRPAQVCRQRSERSVWSCTQTLVRHSRTRLLPSFQERSSSTFPTVRSNRAARWARSTRSAKVK